MLARASTVPRGVPVGATSPVSGLEATPGATTAGDPVGAALAAGDLQAMVALGAAGLLVLAVATVVVLRRGASSRSGDADGGGSTGEASPPDPAAATTSDEDLVLELVAANGGRIRQTRIVERTEWSKSKTSRLLSEMAEDGRIEKVSVGRENLITLPGETPPDVEDDPPGEE